MQRERNRRKLKTNVVLGKIRGSFAHHQHFSALHHLSRSFALISLAWTCRATDATQRRTTPRRARSFSARPVAVRTLRRACGQSKKKDAGGNVKKKCFLAK